MEPRGEAASSLPSAHATALAAALHAGGVSTSPCGACSGKHVLHAVPKKVQFFFQNGCGLNKVQEMRVTNKGKLGKEGKGLQ